MDNKQLQQRDFNSVAKVSVTSEKKQNERKKDEENSQKNSQKNSQRKSNLRIPKTQKEELTKNGCTW